MTMLEQMEGRTLRTSRSRSPAALLGIHVGKRLGGPSSSNHNFMMQVSRDVRKKLYTRESESAQLNSLGPGPAQYLKENADRQRFGERDRFSIPKVSGFSNYGAMFFYMFFSTLFLTFEFYFRQAAVSVLKMRVSRFQYRMRNSKWK